MPNINPEIFKRYDIRGRFPEDLNKDTFKLLVNSYIKVFAPKKIIIGHDPLLGSTEMYEIICEEFAKLGVPVTKIGQVSTPMLYFAAAHFSFSQGIMLTASHQGVGHTGIKAIIDGVPPTAEKIIEMKDNVTEFGIYKDTASEITIIKDFYEEYKSKVKELFPKETKEKIYTVVVDISNGPNGPVAEDLFSNAPAKIVLINKDVRGENLAHDTNPKIEKNREQLKQKVLEENADMGIIWDGDGDRAYFIDWEGTVIAPEFIGSKIGAYLIQNGHGTTMTVDVRGSSAVENEITKVGGKVLRIEAWHVPIKYEMEKDPDIVFGMETSGHYVTRDFYRIDDGLLASLFFLESIKDTDFREELNDFRKRYKIIEEINFGTDKTEQELIDTFKKAYPDGKIVDIDGITIEYKNWRFNVRSSKTEPIIRLNISGSDFDEVEENFEMIKKLIGGEILN